MGDVYTRTKNERHTHRGVEMPYALFVERSSKNQDAFFMYTRYKMAYRHTRV